jgi:hypothetical protein
MSASAVRRVRQHAPGEEDFHRRALRRSMPIMGPRTQSGCRDLRLRSLREHRPPSGWTIGDIRIVPLVSVAPIPIVCHGHRRLRIRRGHARIPIECRPDNPPPADSAAMLPVPPVAAAPPRYIEMARAGRRSRMNEPAGRRAREMPARHRPARTKPAREWCFGRLFTAGKSGARHRRDRMEPRIRCRDMRPGGEMSASRYRPARVEPARMRSSARNCTARHRPDGMEPARMRCGGMRPGGKMSTPRHRSARGEAAWMMSGARNPTMAARCVWCAARRVGGCRPGRRRQQKDT